MFFEKISLAALWRKTVGEQERMQGRPLKSNGSNPDQRGWVFAQRWWPWARSTAGRLSHSLSLGG